MKKFIVAFVALVLLSPAISQASIGLPFGGRVAFTTPCTCNLAAGQISMIITFAQFFTGGIPTPGVSLFYNAPFPSITFKNYNPGTLGSVEIGAYTPGVQAVCFTGLSCAPATIPVLGIINMVGSSLR